MSPDDLRTKAMLLYGRRWKVLLAENLGITRQAVNMMEKGSTRISTKHERKIDDLLATRSKLIQACLANTAPKRVKLSEMVK